MHQKSKFFIITLLLLGFAILFSAKNSNALEETEIVQWARDDLDRLECMQRTLARMNMISPMEGYPPSLPYCPGQICQDFSGMCNPADEERASRVNSTRKIKYIMLDNDNPYCYCYDFENLGSPLACCPGCPNWPVLPEGNDYAEYIASMGGAGDVRFSCRYQKNQLLCFAYRCEQATPAGCKQMWRLERKVRCCTESVIDWCVQNYEYACNGTTRCFDVGADDGVCPSISNTSTTTCTGYPQ